jgi:hypothetical protein
MMFNGILHERRNDAVRRHRAGPRSCSVSDDRMAAAGAMLTAFISYAADRSGLSERQFEFKSFTIIVTRKRTGSRRKTAD